jgi:membrane-associated phospholipid phosphatase
MVGGPVIGNIMLIWAVLIAVSTLYTKQHYILDVLTGLLGGLLISALTFCLLMGR